MKLVDVNVLLNAVNGDSPQHGIAVAWVNRAFSGAEVVGLSWVALLGFVRLGTRRGILASPLTVKAALEIANDWIRSPMARIVEPTAAHWAQVSRLLVGAGTAGNLTTDAHLAALALEHHATLVSFDRDFERFPGLRLEWLGG
jgi:toxin-antitoxin system PIN domain toxin